MQKVDAADILPQNTIAYSGIIFNLTSIIVA
jgi:hypothetical protein